jgi:hypothetical protein
VLRGFDGLDAWKVSSVGVEARSVMPVRGTRWVVCYKVHMLRAPKLEYKASITLWPRVGKRSGVGGKRSNKSDGWNAELIRDDWYKRCGS